MQKSNLTPCEIYLLAKEICLRCHIEEPSYDRVLYECLSPTPQPIVLRGEGSMVWIDKYYAAYEMGGRLRYAYISRTHINEELSSHKRNPASVPEEVYKIISRAYTKLIQSDEQYLCRVEGV